MSDSLQPHGLQHTRLLVSPHSHQHLVLSVFLITVIWVAVKKYLIVFLVSLSRTTNDAEPLFTCLLAIHISFLVTLQFKSCIRFLFGLLTVLLSVEFSVFWIQILSQIHPRTQNLLIFLRDCGK